MSTVNQDELKAIKVLKFAGKENEWERWSEKFIALARARGFAGILLGTEQAPNADEEIDRKKADGSYELTDAERKERKRLRQANGNAYINLQLSCDELPYDLVSLAKTEELPDGCSRDAWERLTSEYDLTEGEDKITLLTMFQQNQLEDVRTNITVWLTSLAIQVNKLKKLHHVLDEEYQITHILASLPREYSSVVEQVKIDRRTSSALITMDEVKKRLKERYLQLKKEHGWSEDEMALSMKSGNNPNKNDRIPSTTPGAEPPRDAKDSGSARSHSTHLETSSSDRPKMVTYTDPQTVPSYMSVKCTRRTLRMPNFTRATHVQPSLSNFPWWDSDFGEWTRSRGTTQLNQNFPTSPKNQKTKLTHCSIYVPMRTISIPQIK